MLAIGLMSGTSMDGIDATLIETDGEAQIKEIAFTSLAYHPSFKILLKCAEFAVKKTNGDLQKADLNFSSYLKMYLETHLQIPPMDLAQTLLKLGEYLSLHLSEIIKHSTYLHSKIVKQLLISTQINAKAIKVVGYHGQTLYHSPLQGLTLQVGDGEFLAKEVGITVVSDFRSNDVKNGGQGAPFAPLYHQALALRDNKIPLAVINCGGIANLSFINSPALPDLMGYDSGPGNALVDSLVKKRTQGQHSCDKDGMFGTRAKAQTSLFPLLYQHSIYDKSGNFYEKKPPKSLDYNDLQLISELDQLPIEEACATLEAFTADSIVQSLDLLSFKLPHTWVLGGGGWKNPVIKREFASRLRHKIPACEIFSADEMGWNSQSLEAQLFAYLAIRSLQAKPLSLPNTTGVKAPTCGGIIHRV